MITKISLKTDSRGDNHTWVRGGWGGCPSRGVQKPIPDPVRPKNKNLPKNLARKKGKSYFLQFFLYFLVFTCGDSR